MRFAHYRQLCNDRDFRSLWKLGLDDGAKGIPPFNLSLDDTEQGLTQEAADAITAFCREQGVT